MPVPEGAECGKRWSVSSHPGEHSQCALVNAFGVALVTAEQQRPQQSAVAESSYRQIWDHESVRLQDCSERTFTLPAMIASMPWTAAARPGTVVTQGMLRKIAAVRIS